MNVATASPYVSSHDFKFALAYLAVSHSESRLQKAVAKGSGHVAIVSEELYVYVHVYVYVNVYVYVTVYVYVCIMCV